MFTASLLTPETALAYSAQHNGMQHNGHGLGER
jgi:hypothetical protein